MKQLWLVILFACLGEALIGCSTYTPAPVVASSTIEPIEFLLEAPKDIINEAHDKEQKIPLGYKWVSDSRYKGVKYLVGVNPLIRIKDIKDCYVCWWPNDDTYAIYLSFYNKEITNSLLSSDKYESRRLAIVMDNNALMSPALKLDESSQGLMIQGAIDKADAEAVVRAILSELNQNKPER